MDVCIWARKRDKRGNKLFAMYMLASHISATRMVCDFLAFSCRSHVQNLN